MVMNKEHCLNTAIHAGLLKKLYPLGKLKALHPCLIWECTLQPTVLSNEYHIKLVYQIGYQPKIYVVRSKLDKGSKEKLPHVYSTEKQHLCLHFPPEKKWTCSQNIADTIIPWAGEWLYHYEIWQLTGNWNGGGTIH